MICSTTATKNWRCESGSAFGGVAGKPAGNLGVVDENVARLESGAAWELGVAT